MNGKIMQVSGSVVDVAFEKGKLPKIKEALTVSIDGKTRVMEVAQHVGWLFTSETVSIYG